MIYCNDLIKLNVLSLFEGELLGVVDKLFFDKKLKKLLELELLTEDGARLILPVKNIYHIGKSAITVKNNQAVKIKVEDSEVYPSPIGCKTFSINGEYLGVIKEISLDEKYFVQKISLDNNQILEVKLVASLGRNTVIFYSGEDKINIKKFTPAKHFSLKKLTSKNTPNKSSQQKENENIKTYSEEIKPKSLIENKPRESQNVDFLVGRICTKDIFNFNNEILIKAHAVISKKILKEISKYGKLRELMLYSK